MSQRTQYVQLGCDGFIRVGRLLSVRAAYREEDVWRKRVEETSYPVVFDSFHHSLGRGLHSFSPVDFVESQAMFLSQFPICTEWTEM